MSRDPLQRLVHALSKLPSIGEKSATRLTFFLLNAEPSISEELISALQEVRAKISFCSLCANLTADDPCRYCADPKRDAGLVCVVESPASLRAIEVRAARVGHVSLQAAVRVVTWLLPQSKADQAAQGIER